MQNHFQDNLIITIDKTVVKGDFLIDDRPVINGMFGEDPLYGKQVLARYYPNVEWTKENFPYGPVLESDWSNFEEIVRMESSN